MMSDWWNSIAASGTPITFRLGPALPRLAKKCTMMSSCEGRLNLRRFRRTEGAASPLPVKLI